MISRARLEQRRGGLVLAEMTAASVTFGAIALRLRISRTTPTASNTSSIRFSRAGLRSARPALGQAAVMIDCLRPSFCQISSVKNGVNGCMSRSVGVEHVGEAVPRAAGSSPRRFESSRYHAQKSSQTNL